MSARNASLIHVADKLSGSHANVLGECTYAWRHKRRPGTGATWTSRSLVRVRVSDDQLRDSTPRPCRLP